MMHKKKWLALIAPILQPLQTDIGDSIAGVLALLRDHIPRPGLSTT